MEDHEQLGQGDPGLGRLIQGIIDNETKTINLRIDGVQNAASVNDQFDPQLITETKRENYSYLLNEADISLLAQFFKLRITKDDRFAVVGDAEILRNRLLDHVKQKKGALVLILNQSGQHWATLVAWQASIGFFADSKNWPIQRQYKLVLKEFREEIPISCNDQLQQDDDDSVNCGLWALKNAEQILSWLAIGDSNDYTKGPILQEVEKIDVHQHFLDLRKEVTDKLIAYYGLDITHFMDAVNRLKQNTMEVPVKPPPSKRFKDCNNTTDEATPRNEEISPGKNLSAFSITKKDVTAKLDQDSGAIVFHHLAVVQPYNALRIPVVHRFLNVSQAESMDFDDDVDEAPTELFSTRAQDHEESEQINHRFTVIDYETLKADIKAERRVVSKDVDSLIFVSKKAETFTAGTGRLDYPLTDYFPLPEKNTKVISVLMERQKIISDDDYRWSVMRFGNYGMKTVYFTFYHHKSMPMRLFRKRFSCEIIKSALKQCLVPSDETSTQQSLDFNENGAGYIRFYCKEWPKVSRAIDDQLTNWSYLIENQIDHFYFYTAEHGMQDDRKDAILLIAAEMNVNINCPHLVLIQAHIARTITALENELLIVKTKDINKILKSEANMKCALVRCWLTKFITDAGHVTVSYKFSSPYTRTHGQTYHPSERLISKMGRGLLIHYLGLGGASFEYFPEHKTIPKFRENARTQMCLMEQYEQVGIDGRIRVEDVHSAETFEDLTKGMGSKKHLLRHLAKNNCLLSFSPWPQYLHMSIGSEIKLLRQAFDEVEQHGCCRMTQSTIVDLHKAESKLKYFVMPHKYKTFDYQTAKNMIEKGEIKIISFEKSSTPIDHDADVNDDDTLSDMMTDHEEGGEEVVYDNRNILPGTPTSDQSQTLASREGCLLDSINLRKFSGHILVETYVPTLLKFLPKDGSTNHPLQSVDGKINFIFTVIACVARLVRLDGSASNIFVQNPKTAFKGDAVKAFISKHQLQNSIKLKGTITRGAVTDCILRPDKLFPCILLSFLKLNVEDKIVKSKINAFLNEHVDYFPNAFLVKGILHGGYATNRWWKVASSREAFPDATADDSSAIRKERNLAQNRPVSQKLKARYSCLKNHGVWIDKKLNKGRRKKNVENEK